jgi:hypothetical protein
MYQTFIAKLSGTMFASQCSSVGWSDQTSHSVLKYTIPVSAIIITSINHKSVLSASMRMVNAI